MSRQLNWFIGKQQKYDSFIIGQSKRKDKKCKLTPPLNHNIDIAEKSNVTAQMQIGMVNVQ